MQVKSIAESSKREHSAILLTFIKLPFVIKIIVLYILSGCFTQILLYSSLLSTQEPKLSLWVISSVLTFFKINFFQKKIQEHYQSVKQFGTKSGPTFCPNVLQRLSADDKSPC